MKKTIFAVSDIHNEYDVLIDALNKAGFDENNPEHLLVSVGDAFDRGESAFEVYEYLKRLSDKGSAVVLKGNHTKFFTGYLDGTILSPLNYYNNGTNETMASFLHETSPFETYCVLRGIEQPTYGDFADWVGEARQEINGEFPELLEWLKTRPYYLETKNYIFTHGAIDTDAKDWHEPHCTRYHFTDWEALMWDDGSFFGKEINNTDKTVVIGHFGTSTLRKKYGYSPNRNPLGSFDILRRKDGRVIAIDATTNYSKKVNVLVIENEELLDD